MCTQCPKQLSLYLKRNVIGWDYVLNGNVQCIILLKWGGMGSNIYCSWGLGPQQLKGALNHAVIKHLGCLLRNIFVPQIIAALKPLLVPLFVFIGFIFCSLCEFHCFLYLEMHLKLEVMIKSQHCSLPCRNIKTTVFKDERVLVQECKNWLFLSFWSSAKSKSVDTFFLNYILAGYQTFSLIFFGGGGLLKLFQLQLCEL